MFDGKLLSSFGLKPEESNLIRTLGILALAKAGYDEVKNERKKKVEEEGSFFGDFF